MEFIDQLKGNLRDYGCVPFWSLNGLLSKHELGKQILAMKEAGIGGYILHARKGLKTEYLSEEWFDAIGFCLDKARQLGMNVWIYDESGWPSGFVEGRLLKDPANWVQYLRHEIRASISEDMFNEPNCYIYVIEGGTARRLKKLEQASEYHIVYVCSHPAFVDILDPNVVEQFIGQTHEQYYKRFKNYFGKELVGFFTDEPQYFRYATPYTKKIRESFWKEYGEDVFDGLVYLFLQNESAYSFRFRYYKQMNALYVHNFYKRLYDWCEEHSCKLTGHSVEENRLHTQMWGGAGVMPTYEYEHIPAVDWLSRNIDCVINPKQIGSVAAQLGKKQVLTETFGCAGYDVTPRELARITHFQYVNGVNLMCQHISHYSMEGARKHDCPPAFGAYMPWWKDYKEFNDYFTRLGYLVANTQECVNTLVIHPMSNVYFTYDRSCSYESIRELEDAFVALTEDLTRRGVCFHYGDAELIRKYGKVEGKKFIVGKYSYDYVVIPAMAGIESATAKLLREYLSSGGNVVLQGKPLQYLDGKREDLDDIAGNCSLKDIPVEIPVRVVSGEDSREPLIVGLRKGDCGKLVYVFNSSWEKDRWIRIDQPCEILDLSCVCRRRAEFPLRVPAGNAVLLLPIGEALRESPSVRVDEVVCTEDFHLFKTDRNALVVDFAQTSTDGVRFSESWSVYAINEYYIKKEYRGTLHLRYSFTVKDIPNQMILRYEKMRSKKIRINGSLVAGIASNFDSSFYDADITAYLVTGDNEIVFEIEYYQHDGTLEAMYGKEALESIKNIFVMDTELEPITLLGDFCVDEGRRIVRYELPSDFSALQKKGYPHFFGDAWLKGTIVYDPKSVAELELKGRFMTAEVFVEGASAGKFVCNDRLDVTKFLHSGKNEVEIRITSSLRNLLGPFHYSKDPEPFGVDDSKFNMFGTWDGGTSVEFNPRYSLVDFGVREIVLHTKRMDGYGDL